MSEQTFRTFEEFWPYYVREHSKKETRSLHFLGTSLAAGCLAVAALTRRANVALLAPVVGYGLSWIGHYYIEKNRPATFTYPLWSFRGDLRMWRLIAAGTMDDEVERVTASNGVHAAPAPKRPAAAHTVN